MDITGITLNNIHLYNTDLAKICRYYGLGRKYSLILAYLNRGRRDMPISKAIQLYMSKQPSLESTCKARRVSYNAVVKFRDRNNYYDFSNDKLIDLYIRNRKPKKKKPIDENSLRQICKGLELKYSTVCSYKNNHPELSLDDVILYQLNKQHGYDRKRLIEIRQEIGGLLNRL